MIQFKENTTYKAFSPCNTEAVWLYRVTKRTAKTITIKGDFTGNNTTKTCRISVINGEEVVKPLGNYSMSPILRAKNNI